MRRFNRYLSVLLAAAILGTGSGVTTLAATNTDVYSNDILTMDAAETEELLIEDSIDVADDFSLEDSIVEDALIEEEDDFATEAEDTDFATEYDEAELEKYLTNRDVDIPIEESELANEQNLGTLPAKYDMRSILPAVRNQNPYGTCWTFSTMAGCEGSMMKNGSDSSIDLAERQLAYFFYHNKGISDPLGNVKDDYNELAGSDDAYDIGGNKFMASIFLTGWRGPVDEVAAPYSGIPATLDSNLMYGNSYAHLQQTRIIPFSATNLNNLKQAIMDYNIVGISYYHSGSYLNSSNAAYFRSASTSGTNHAVAVVGWDDDYAVTNFRSGNQPATKGAWLVRNSWGSGWGDGGYMWISYTEGSLKEAVAFGCESANNYENNYFYDGTSGTYSNTYSSGASFANVFKASGNETIKAVSMMLSSSDTKYSIQIYKNPTSSDPTSGTKLLSTPVSGTTTYSGYYTVKLPNPVTVGKGDKFAVVFTLTASSGNSVGAYYEKSYTQSGWVKFNAATSAGQSYYKAPSGSWTDVNSSGMCYRIHAFTDTTSSIYKLDKERVTLKVGTGDKISVVKKTDAAVENDEEFGIDTASATFTSSNKDVVTVDASGNIKAVDEGVAEIYVTAPDKGKLTCAVTVSGYQIDKLIASDTNIELESGATKSVTLNYEPVGAATSYYSKTTITPGDSSIIAVKNKTLTSGTTARFEVEGKTVTEPVKTYVEIKVADEVKPLTVSCNVMVYPKDTAEVPSGLALYLTTNEGTKLSNHANELKEALNAMDNGLGDQWMFANPNEVIEAYEGIESPVSVELVHTNPYTKEKVYDEIPVYVTTVKGASELDVTKSKLMAGESVDISSAVELIGYEGNKSKYTVEYSVNNTSLATVSNNRLTANKAGAVTVTAKVMKDGVAVKNAAAARKTFEIVNVSGKGLASVSINVLRKTTATNEVSVITPDADGIYVLTNSKDYEYYLEDGVSSSDFKISYTTTDSSVTKVTKANKDAASGRMRAKLTALKGGYSYVTATANDAVKSNQTFKFCVYDTSPASVSLSKSVFTFNPNKTEQTDNYAEIYTGFGAHIVSGNLIDSKKSNVLSGFRLAVGSGAKFAIEYDGAAKSTTGYIHVALKNGDAFDTYDIPVKLNVKAEVPKATVKQTRKVNTFYKDSSKTGRFVITVPNESIVSVNLVDNGKNGAGKPLGYESEDYSDGSSQAVLQVKLKNPENEKNKKARIEIYLEDYAKPITKDVTIATESVTLVPSLTSTTMLTEGGMLIPGDVVAFNLKNKTTGTVEKLTVDDTAVNLVSVNGFDPNSIYDRIAYNDDVMIGYLDYYESGRASLPAKGHVFNVEVSNTNWYKSVVIKNFTIKPLEVTKASLGLEKSTVTLGVYNDAEYDEGLAVEARVGFKKGNHSFYMNKISVTGANKASSNALKYNFKTPVINESGLLRMDVNKNNAPAPGTYKFRLSLSPEQFSNLKKPISTTLTVKVKKLNINKAKVVSAKLSGKLDVLDRADSEVVITPKFTNLPAGYVVSNISLTGKNAGLYRICDLKANGKATLMFAANRSDNFYTSRKNPVTVKYTIVNRYGITIADCEAKINVPVTQGKLTAKVRNTINTFSNTKPESRLLDITAYNASGENIDIEKVTLMNENDDFKLEKRNGKYYINYVPNGKVARGKSYTFKLKVYAKGKALNTKPLTVNYKVSVSK